MNDDLISVIIPIYNGEKYIENCLNSIINQSYTNLEIIVLNDGSTDNTLEILNEFKKKDKRIKVIDKKNTGVSHTRNVGISTAIGKYLTFIDIDDWVEKDFIEELHKSIVRENVEVVRCNYFFVKNNKKQVRELNKLEYCKYDEKNINTPISNFLLSLEGNENYVMLLMIKNDKEKILFNENLTYMEDVVFYFDLLSNKKSIYFINKALYNYRSNQESVTNSPEKNIVLIKELFKERNTLFDKLNGKKDLLENIELTKSILNANYLKIISVRLGRYVRNRIKYTEFKNTFNNMRKSMDCLFENYNCMYLNRVEKVLIKLIKNKRVLLLYIFYRIKGIIFQLVNKSK